jgi:hypothetical protein
MASRDCPGWTTILVVDAVGNDAAFGGPGSAPGLSVLQAASKTPHPISTPTRHFAIDLMAAPSLVCACNLRRLRNL